MIKRIIITEIIALIIAFGISYCFLYYVYDSWDYHTWNNKTLFYVDYAFNGALISGFLQFLQSFLYNEKQFKELRDLIDKIK